MSADPVPAAAVTGHQRRILVQPLHAILGVNRPGRAPQLSVVWFEWDGTVIRFSTRSGRVKARLMADDARVSLLVDDPSTNSYVCVYGTVSIGTEGHPELAARLRARYLPDVAHEAPPESDRIVVTLTPSRVVSGS